MGFDLRQLSVADTLSCSAQLRLAIDGQATVEATARKACSFLYTAFADVEGKTAIPLVRLYITHPYAKLPPEDQRFAGKLLNAPAARWPLLKCLTLLATRGDQEDWNDRTRSRGHRAIPLPTTATLEQAPMIAQLFLQMGVELSNVLRAEPVLFPDLARKTYNVFHVPKALGSAYIPAQDEFVRRHAIESVVGFGGALPWGEHFAVVLFSRAVISTKVASRFKSFALDLKARMLKLTIDNVFEQAESVPAASATSVAAWSTAQETSMANVESSVVPASRKAEGYREFRDSRGVDWTVWAVHPGATALGRLRGNRWKSGWLLFESEGESRRFSPIPEAWPANSERELEAMCGSATPARR